MKLGFFAALAFIVFFLLGRSSPLRLASTAVDETSSVQPTEAPTKNSTDSNALLTSKAKTSVKPVAEPKVDLREFLARETGSILFSYLYSPAFAENWAEARDLVSARLMSPLPKRDASPKFDDEVVNRLGLIKALGEVAKTEAIKHDVKTILIGYLRSSKDEPWALEREAAHSLLENQMLSARELEELMPKLDVRTRNTASVSDRELAAKITKGEDEN